MALSIELAREFAKVTNDTGTVKNTSGTTVSGTAVEYAGGMYVRLDGSDQLTPVISSTAGVKDGDRVTVLIKDHTTTVTGNTSSPSAGKDDVDGIKGELDDAVNQISEFEIVIAGKVDTEVLNAEKARIDELVAENVTIKEKLTATEADIGTLTADNVAINEKLTANSADIENLNATKLDADIADIKYATIDSLEATDANIHNLEADYGEFKQLSTDKFTANDASIEDLKVNKLDAEQADLKYANIDFANIGKAAIENFFSKSGMIGDLVVGDGTITGTLVGVTIKGDLIEGGTVKADKLVVQGTDGLYYKLNITGETVAAEQTEYNSLNGSIITAKSITAEKISVNDLVAFGATIGGFKINASSIYSGVKESVNNTTRGIYMDDTGQIAFGDQSNYLKYFQDTDGTWKLAIAANEIKIGASNKDISEVITDEIQNGLENVQAVKSSAVTYQAGSSGTTPPTGNWSSAIPAVSSGQYLWTRTVITYTDGSSSTAYSVGRMGEDGSPGSPGSPGTPGKDGTSVTVISTATTYAVSTSGTSMPSSGWQTSVPSVAQGSYLWTRVITTYSDGKTATAYSVARQGSDGSDGTDGVGIKSSTVTYQAGSSGTTVPTGAWSSSIPSVAAGQYLWTKTVITYTDGKSTTSYSVGRMGQNGAPGSDGSDGRGVKSTSITYQAGASQTSAPTSTWTTTVPTLTTAKPYLWTRTVITYTDNTTSTSYSVSSTLESFEVGGRNYLENSKEEQTSTASTHKEFLRTTFDLAPFFDEYGLIEVTLSFDLYSEVAGAIQVYCQNGSGSRYAFSKSVNATTEWERYSVTFTPSGPAETQTESYLAFYGVYDSGRIPHVRMLKLEKGNKATDWTPAPEDMATNDDLSTSEDQLNDRIDETTNRVELAESSINILSDSIASMVVDSNGESLMTQTTDGWQFNIGFVQQAIDDASENIQGLKGDVSTAQAAIDEAQALLDDVANKTAYINITTYEGLPAIELGKSDSDFKLRITNEKISFIDNSDNNNTEVAYISNKKLYIETAVIKNEIKIGEENGFVFRTRSNGNMGLRWEWAGNANLVANSKIPASEGANKQAYGFGLRPLASPPLKPNTIYTFSANGRTNDDKTSADKKYLVAYIYATDWSFSHTISIPETSDTTKSVTFTTPSNIASKTVYFNSYYYPSQGNSGIAPAGTCTINWYKLEEGSEATPWRPAAGEE